MKHYENVVKRAIMETEVAAYRLSSIASTIGGMDNGGSAESVLVSIRDQLDKALTTMRAVIIFMEANEGDDV